MAAVWVQQVLEKLTGFSDCPANKVILIKLDQQKLYLLEQGLVFAEYPISSSKHGIGCQQDSDQTPIGVHRIAEKIGDNCHPGEILKARVATGKIAEIISAPQHGDKDLITSRILWLSGLEVGLNCGDGVDSYQRYIYIHGTPEEGLIGQPASIGCIRMKNNDVIDLYNNVGQGMLVNIVE